MEIGDVKRELYNCLKFRCPNEAVLNQAIDIVARPCPSLTEYYALRHGGAKREVIRLYDRMLTDPKTDAAASKWGRRDPPNTAA